MKKITVELLKKSLIRAVWTIAQTALGMITVGAALHEIDWMHMLSVSAVAGIASFLKSIVIGIPEVTEADGTLTIDTTDPDDPDVLFDMGNFEFNDLINKGTIKVDVVNDKIPEEE